MTPREPKRTDWCFHRTAFDKERFPTCKAGIDYSAFMDGPMGLMPCLAETPEAIARCPSYRAWTPEEIAARDADLAERGDRMRVVVPAIVAATEAGRWSGSMPCPGCKTGVLHYSRARSNGHIHAWCTTPGCVSFMQ